MPTAERQRNGSLLVTDIIGGQFKKMVYYGYTKKEAIAEFNIDKVWKEKDMCYCHTCDREIHCRGIARHRAAHRDRKQDCKITFSTGDTYIYNFSKRKENNNG